MSTWYCFYTDNFIWIAGKGMCRTIAGPSRNTLIVAEMAVGPWKVIAEAVLEKHYPITITFPL